jgi:glycosyltransferase involved in cell wall biosynthesis
MTAPLTIAVMRDRYPTRFNTPKHSRHRIEPTLFLPTHRISSRIEGMTLFWPTRSDLIHSVNRIPALGGRRFVISFESHLPRYYGGERTRFFAHMRRRLAAPQCRRIVAMSQFARRTFEATHAAAEEAAALSAKLEVVYPNIVLPEPSLAPRRDGPLELVFVGAHFGRKGGAAAARAAEIARRRGLPLRFQIISSLTAGGEVWSDPRDPAFFAPYLRLLDGDNVVFRRSAPNAEVVETLRGADFSILTTLSDTFGYTAIESLAVGTPVVATPQGALPEFIVDGVNGLIAPLEVDAFGEWIHVGRSDKDSRRFEALYRDAIEALAEAIVEAVLPFVDAPDRLAAMRRAARATAEARFDSRKASPILDRIYEESAGPR